MFRCKGISFFHHWLEDVIDSFAVDDVCWRGNLHGQGIMKKILVGFSMHWLRQSSLKFWWSWLRLPSSIWVCHGLSPKSTGLNLIFPIEKLPFRGTFKHHFQANPSPRHRRTTQLAAFDESLEGEYVRAGHTLEWLEISLWYLVMIYWYIYIYTLYTHIYIYIYTGVPMYIYIEICVCVSTHWYANTKLYT